MAGRLAGGWERGYCHFWSHSAIQQNVYLKSPCRRHLSSARPPGINKAVLGLLSSAQAGGSPPPPQPHPRKFRSLKGPLPCHGKDRRSRILGPCLQRQERPIQRLKLSPARHFGLDPEGFRNFSCGVPPGECPDALPGTTLGVRRPLSSLGAEGLRGFGTRASYTWHSQWQPSQAAPGASEGLPQLWYHGPVSYGVHR